MTATIQDEGVPFEQWQRQILLQQTAVLLRAELRRRAQRSFMDGAQYIIDHMGPIFRRLVQVLKVQSAEWASMRYHIREARRDGLPLWGPHVPKLARRSARRWRHGRR